MLVTGRFLKLSLFCQIPNLGSKFDWPMRITCLNSLLLSYDNTPCSNVDCISGSQLQRSYSSKPHPGNELATWGFSIQYQPEHLMKATPDQARPVKTITGSSSPLVWSSFIQNSWTDTVHKATVRPVPHTICPVFLTFCYLAWLISQPCFSALFITRNPLHNNLQSITDRKYTPTSQHTNEQQNR